MTSMPWRITALAIIRTRVPLVMLVPLVVLAIGARRGRLLPHYFIGESRRLLAGAIVIAEQHVLSRWSICRLGRAVAADR